MLIKPETPLGPCHGNWGFRSAKLRHRMPDVSTCGRAGGFEQPCVYLQPIDMFVREWEPFGKEKR